MSHQVPVSQIMTADPMVLRPQDPVDRVAREMELGAIRHMPIVSEGGILRGLITHRDLVGMRNRQGAVADVMRTDVKTVAPETAACEAAYLLLRHKIGCVPVTDRDGVLLGIVTETDFVRIAYALLGGSVPVDQLELEEEEARRV